MDPTSLPVGPSSPMGDVSDWIAIANTVISIALFVFVWTSRRNQATREQIAETDKSIHGLTSQLQEEVRDIHKRVSGVVTRVARLEEWRQQVPGTADVEKLYTEIAIVKGDIREMNAGVRAISESVTGVQKSVSLVNEHLLQQDKQLERTTERSGRAS